MKKWCVLGFVFIAMAFYCLIAQQPGSTLPQLRVNGLTMFVLLLVGVIWTILEKLFKMAVRKEARKVFQEEMTKVSRN